FGEIYWLSNPTEEKIETDISLRCCGYMPMLWRAEDGSGLPLAYCGKEGRTSFHLALEAHDAVFVVLVRKAGGCEDAAGYAMDEEAVHKTSKQVDGPWKVLFHSPVYESFEREFSRLADFSQVEGDDDVRYFSGCAAYSKTIDCDGFRTLDLGKVYGIAELLVNGESRGIQWHAPYRFDLNGLPAGENNIEIRITTPWRNRLIGDRQPGRDGVRTFCSNTAITAESPLVPSGLLGPVVLY
ncbi:MAG: hypothetical protein HUJ91_03550, partial [Bacteroidales bacterium]|nr:hypothetical protein [Bacteroidales bacterium]